jgi:hypothetical protein
MKKIMITILFVCAWLCSQAQTNYVKNGDFEEYYACPDTPRRVYYAKDWENGTYKKDYSINNVLQYNNRCSNGITGVSPRLLVPNNSNFYQEPHSEDGMIGICMMYFDYITLVGYIPPNPSKYSSTLRGALHKPLTAGRSYCVTFYVNNGELGGYAHNKIGAYLDDGSIRFLIDSLNKAITSVTPQVYTDSVIIDTMNWTKIQGTFVAKGDETSITIGNFFPNSAVTAVVTNYYHVYEHESYYLIDDVSVVPIDAKANAGADRWVAISNSTDIGPVEDTTAVAMDCKWYHKGKLIDSGNVITVNAASSINQIDTYVVVQNVCGNITRDTMLLKTTSLSAKELEQANGFSLYPNPSNGTLTITSLRSTKQSVTFKVYDLLGREVYRQTLNFSNKLATLQFTAITGVYILELLDSEGNVWRERIVIE